MNRRSMFFVAAGVALIALAIGIAANLWSPREGELPTIAGFVYPQPRKISPFVLTAQDGSQFTLDRLRGKWTFAYFGYTYCPDVCPTTLAELARVQSLLNASGVDNATQYLFVSVDPKRDTPQHLAQYVPSFSKKLIGVTGSRAEIDELTRQVGVAYEFPEGTDKENYPVSHSSIVALFDPDARLHAIFTAPHKAELIAEGFRKLSARWRSSAG
jgi:protein SCO1/2